MFFWLFQPSLLNCGALLFKNLVKWSIPGKCSFQLVHHLCTCAWYVEYLHLHIWSRNLLLQKSSFIYVYVDNIHGSSGLMKGSVLCHPVLLTEYSALHFVCDLWSYARPKHWNVCSHSAFLKPLMTITCCKIADLIHPPITILHLSPSSYTTFKVVYVRNWFWCQVSGISFSKSQEFTSGIRGL